MATACRHAEGELARAHPTSGPGPTATRASSPGSAGSTREVRCEGRQSCISFLLLHYELALRRRQATGAHRRQTEMIRPWIVGFKTTFGHMFKKPITVNYPDEKVPMFPKWRGKQVLMRDENGLEKCVACGLCAVACPADAIYLEAAENDGSVMAGPRYAPDLPDSQDPLHLLRVLRRGLPGVGHFHGQGLRTGRVQQGRLRLGQGRPPGAPGQARRSARATRK